jgi:hypothetical protein
VARLLDARQLYHGLVLCTDKAVDMARVILICNKRMNELNFFLVSIFYVLPSPEQMAVISK